MEELLARYLDGELSVDEAEKLLRVAGDDPRVDRALREYEDVLEAARQLPSLPPPAAFGDRVMAAIDRRRQRAIQPRASTPWRSWLAAAAMLVLGVFLGHQVNLRKDAPTGPPTADTHARAVVIPGTVPADEPGVEYLRAIRLAYAPSRPDVRSVAVAGSFNGWDPSTTPLRREGDVWTILLVLPAGSHEYMFIEDGARWITDPVAPRTRKDGFGGSNGLLDVSL
jgi:hypothetical protein